MALVETLKDAATGTPARRPRSARRTSHIDMLPVGDGLDLVGAARDLLTGRDGDAHVSSEATVHAALGPGHLLRDLATTPSAAVSSLLGLTVAGGFRQAVDAAVPDERDARTPLYLLLDDLPVAALISGYATLYLQPDPAERPPADPDTPRRGPKSDLCAGWRRDGTMMTAIATDGVIPVPVGPPAPRIEPPDDPWGWHTIGGLAPGAMRRRRLVDVTWGEPLEVFAMFRDTHVDLDGSETVLHEYHVDLTVDPTSFEILGCAATPHVLPWIECPAAAASAHRLEGHAVGEVRTIVRQEFRGTSTCTHLNDLLRSLADVASMAGHLST